MQQSATLPAIAPPSLLSRIFGLPALLITGLLISPFFSSTSIWKGDVLGDPDIWWHMRNAQVLLQTHHFIHKDLYSFTTGGLPWINPEWLAEIPYYLGYRLMGTTGLFLVLIAAVEFIIIGVLLLSYLRSGSGKAAYVATWGAVLLAAVNVGPRTILFGWICFLLELLILESFRRGRDRLWLLIPVFCLWINLHGSWMIGLVFFGLFGAAGLVGGSWGAIEARRWTPAQARKLVLITAGVVAALFVNPYGWRLVFYPFDMAFQQKLNISSVEEWRSVNFHLTNGKIMLAVMVCLALVTLLRRRVWPLQDVLFALLALYSALTYVRFLFLAGLVLCPLLAIDLADVFPRSRLARTRPVLNAIFMAVLLGDAIVRIPSTAMLQEGIRKNLPVEAMSAVSALPPQSRIFNFYAWGGYMIWNARNHPVFVDSRTDIFEHHGIFGDYMQAIDLTNTLDILDKYHIDYVLFPREDAVAYLLEHTPGWRMRYQDGTAALFERTSAASLASPQQSHLH